MSPNFWGCRCCGRPLLATVDSNGTLYVRSLKTGFTVWTYNTLDASVMNVRFITKNRVVVISSLYRWIIERDGATGNGVLISRIRDTHDRLQGAFSYGVDCSGGVIAIYAEDDRNSDYTGTYNPYTADSDGNVINVFPCYSASTIGLPNQSSFNGSTDVVLSSTGDMYIAGVPHASTDNTSGIWRLDNTGAITDKFNAPTTGVRAMAINASDVIFVGFGTEVASLDASLSVNWSQSALVQARSICVRETTATLFCRESGDVIRERSMSDGAVVSEYSGVYKAYFGQFRIDESSGDFICGGTSMQGVFRINPSSDDVVWDGYTNSNIIGMDVWYS